MFSLGKPKCLRLSFAGVVVLAIASSCAAQTSRVGGAIQGSIVDQSGSAIAGASVTVRNLGTSQARTMLTNAQGRSEEHTSELQSQSNLVCRLLLEKKKK